MGALRWLYSRLPKPTADEQVASTVTLSREFAKMGITGVIDGGGVNSGPDVYGPVHEARRREELVTRVRLTVHSSGPGAEAEEYPAYLRYVHPRSGDPMLQVLGLGEIVLFAVHDAVNRHPDLSPETIEELRQIFDRFAEAHWPLQIHTILPETISAVVELWEEVDRRHPIGGLRWSLVHAESLTPELLPRLRALGAGVVCPSLFRFEGDTMLDAWGAERLASAPALRAMLDSPLPLAGGTDAMRVASYDPFAALQWYVTGLTMTGRTTRDVANRLTREEALALYTRAGAWFSFEEDERGTLEPGKLADLAVLDKDYLSVPVEEISTIGVDLTLLGGRPVWAAAPYSGLGRA